MKLKYNPANEVRMSQTPLGRDLERAESQGKSAQQLIDETPSAGFSAQEYINALNAKKPKPAMTSKPKQKISLINKSALYKFYRIPKQSSAQRIKILKYANTLERQRLQQKIIQLKLQRKLQVLQAKAPLQIRPINAVGAVRSFSPDPTINNDVATAFNADIGTGENYFGGEKYFGGESYYDEDYYGNEFDNTPEEHLGLDVRRRGSPFFM